MLNWASFGFTCQGPGPSLRETVEPFVQQCGVSMPIILQ